LNWKKSLQENRTLSIKNIGVLSLNADNNIQFTPNEQTNYLAQSFGLTTFVSPAVKREIEMVKTEKETKEKGITEIENIKNL